MKGAQFDSRARRQVARAFFDMLSGRPSADWAAALQGHDGAALMNLARQQKCHRDLLEFWDKQGTLAPALASELAALRHAGEQAAEITGLLPSDCILLKGASLLRFYPPGTIRQSSDVDVLVRDFAGLRQLHERLLEARYLPWGTGYWWIDAADPRRGRASMRYMRTEAADPLSVEVQVGGFPVGWDDVLPADALVDGSVEVPGLACRALAPQHQLELAFADFHGRRSSITVRHLVDLRRLFEHAGSALDPEALARRLREIGACKGPARLRSDMEALGLRDEIPAPLRQVHVGMRPADQRLRVLPLLERLASFIERRNVPRPLAAMALQAPLVLRVLAGGRRVCAVPLSNAPQRELALVRGDGRLYFTNPAGVFVLSLLRFRDDARKRLFDDMKRCKRLRKLEAPHG